MPACLLVLLLAQVTLREVYGLPKDIALHLVQNYGTRALQVSCCASNIRTCFLRKQLLGSLCFVVAAVVPAVVPAAVILAAVAVGVDTLVLLWPCLHVGDVHRVELGPREMRSCRYGAVCGVRVDRLLIVQLSWLRRL